MWHPELTCGLRLKVHACHSRRQFAPWYMTSLQDNFDSLITDWCDFVNDETQPYDGYSMYDAQPPMCKCEAHPWDILAAGTVSRHCDIFMGLYYGRDANGRDPLEVEVFIGGMPVCLLTLSPGDKTLAFEGITFISMISLTYHDVSLRPSCLSSAHDLHLIYANIPLTNRSQLATSSPYFITPEAARGKYTRAFPMLRYLMGMAALSLFPPEPFPAGLQHGAIRLPEFPVPRNRAAGAIRRNQVACTALLDQFREELLQTAWHPARHVQWCLDTDALEGLEDLLPDRRHDSRLWYDEVLVISSSEEPAVKECMEVIRHHDSSRCFSCLESDGRTWTKIMGQADRYLAFDPCKPHWVTAHAQGAGVVHGLLPLTV